MSFEGLFHEGSGGAPYGSVAMTPGAVSQPCLVSPSLPKAMMSSPGLSLGLQSNMRGKRDPSRIAGAAGGAAGGGGGDDLESVVGEENESRSGSDNLGGLSGDDLDQENPLKRKRYHRHTPQQIQELEALFKECPHPDEKQRMELSKRLHLAPRQVKFWFQNRRTQMKMQLERHENSLLRQENDRLRAENMSIRDAMRSPICSGCGGPAMLGEVSFEEQHLKIENARLKDELDRVCAVAEKFLGRSIPPMASPLPPPMLNSSLELGVGNNGYASLGSVVSVLAAGNDFVAGMTSPLATVVTPLVKTVGSIGMVDRSLLLELALAAVDELIKMAQMGEPLWVSSLDGGKEMLNYEEYLQTFPRCIGMKPTGFVSEASRETGIVIINSMAFVETLMDANRWAEMFPGVIARAATTEVISSGMGGTRNGALQLMHAELQVLSPLLPIRDVNFLRFCKQLTEEAWAVVDVSIDGIRENPSTGTAYMSCRRLPSGCLVQDLPNGYSKVTWVEHSEYDQSAVHQLFRPLLRSGMALGAQRWVAALQRQCECLAILMSTSLPTHEPAGMTPAGKRSMLKLAARMTCNFCAGVCASSARKWSRLSGGSVGVGEDVRVMTRQSVDDPGEPPGVVLSAATSVWLPVGPQRLFQFLRDERLRSEWDILSNGGPMQEMEHIAKGRDDGNAVSLLSAGAVRGGQSSMLILQETSTDASGSLVVYAPVDVPAMHLVLGGGDSAYVALLPSGFAILPDGSNFQGGNGDGVGVGPQRRKVDGSLLTVAFQILVNSLPTAKLTVESVETVNNLISCTIQKIRAALRCEA